MWACAKLQKQPALGELQLVVQTFLQPGVVDDATDQNLANVGTGRIGSAARLAYHVPLEHMPTNYIQHLGGVGEQDVQQLLGQDQLQMLAASDSSQNTSIVLVGLANMAAGTAPIISLGFARVCSRKLLAMFGPQARTWIPQHTTNAMWACGELGLANEPFIAAAVAAAPRWLPQSTGFDLTQAASACAKLQNRDEGFLMQVLQKAGDLLHQSSKTSSARDGKGSKSLTPVGVDSLVAVCSLHVAEINMPQLAKPMRGSFHC
jgi:hypothetical protein